VFVNRQLIYDYPEQLFTESGIMAIEHADFEPLERLALVTGGEIVSTFDHPEEVKLGTCDLIEEMVIGEDRVLRFSGCPNGAACTIVLRGSSSRKYLYLNRFGLPLPLPPLSSLLSPPPYPW
jgi:T-complex protein 1 subunit beta